MSESIFEELLRTVASSADVISINFGKPIRYLSFAQGGVLLSITAKVEDLGFDVFDDVNKHEFAVWVRDEDVPLVQVERDQIELYQDISEDGKVPELVVWDVEQFAGYKALGCKRRN